MRVFFCILLLLTTNLVANEVVTFKLTLPNGGGNLQEETFLGTASTVSKSERRLWRVGGRKIAVYAYTGGNVLFLSIGPRYVTPKQESFVGYIIPTKWGDSPIPLSEGHTSLGGSWWKDAHLSIQPLCQNENENKRVIIIIR